MLAGIATISALWGACTACAEDKAIMQMAAEVVTLSFTLVNELNSQASRSVSNTGATRMLVSIKMAISLLVLGKSLSEADRPNKEMRR